MMVLLVAAWFHDTGYLFVEHAIHEEKSVSLMLEFIQPFQLATELEEEMKGCILSTECREIPKAGCRRSFVMQILIILVQNSRLPMYRSIKSCINKTDAN